MWMGQYSHLILYENEFFSLLVNVFLWAQVRLACLLLTCSCWYWWKNERIFVKKVHGKFVFSTFLVLFSSWFMHDGHAAELQMGCKCMRQPSAVAYLMLSMFILCEASLVRCRFKCKYWISWHWWFILNIWWNFTFMMCTSHPLHPCQTLFFFVLWQYAILVTRTTVCALHSFSYCAAKQWNSLPFHIFQLPTLVHLLISSDFHNSVATARSSKSFLHF